MDLTLESNGFGFEIQWIWRWSELGLGQHRADVGLGVRLLLRVSCMVCTEDLRDGWRINRRGSERIVPCGEDDLGVLGTDGYYFSSKTHCILA